MMAMIVFWMSMMMTQVMTMTMTMTPMTVSTSSLHGSHDREAKNDSHRPQQTRHAILAQLVPGQHLKEGDVE